MNTFRARVGAACLVVAGVGAVVGAALIPAHATATVTTSRIAGANRYDTGKLIGEYKASGSSSFAFGAPSQAVLVSGDNFPDALAATFLAGAYKSPVFLTGSKTLSPEALQGLQDLGIKQVTIVGGPGAVDPSEDATLNSDGITTSRIQGANRDDTAAMVAQANGTTVGTYSNVGTTALVAADNSDHYVDALSGGPLSFAGHLPIVLTGTDALAPEARTALANLKVKHAIILGGPGAVSTDVEAAIDGMNITTERLQGGNRQQTAIAIAAAAHRFLGFTFKQIFLAVGNNFPDALAGGALAGLLKAPTLLTTDPDSLSADTQGFIRANDGEVARVTAFGGPLAISDTVLSEAGSTAVCQPATTTTTAAGLPLPAPLANASARPAAAAATTTSTTVPKTTTTLEPCQTTTTPPPTTSSTTTTAPGATTTAPASTLVPGGPV